MKKNHPGSCSVSAASRRRHFTRPSRVRVSVSCQLLLLLLLLLGGHGQALVLVSPRSSSRSSWTRTKSTFVPSSSSGSFQKTSTTTSQARLRMDVEDDVYGGPARNGRRPLLVPSPPLCTWFSSSKTQNPPNATTTGSSNNNNNILPPKLPLLDRIPTTLVLPPHTPSTITRANSSSSSSHTRAPSFLASPQGQAALQGLPWQSSSPVVFLPFWKHHVLNVLEQHLTNVQVESVVSPVTGRNLAYLESFKKNKKNKKTSGTVRVLRMHTLVVSSREFRRIRYTLVDGGDDLQVFTSVWYPHPKHAASHTHATPPAPLLGVDLLQFANRQQVCIMDVQPLHHSNKNKNNHKNDDDDQQSKASLQEHLLQELYDTSLSSIRHSHPSLQQPMSRRFYNSTRDTSPEQFFSSQLLLGRFDRGSPSCTTSSSTSSTTNPKDDDKDKDQDQDDPVYQTFFPAHAQYLQTYLDFTKQYAAAAATTATPVSSISSRNHHSKDPHSCQTHKNDNTDLPHSQQQEPHDEDDCWARNVQTAWDRHVAYDTYSAERDPAQALLTQHFGAEIAHDYVYHVLFPLAATTTTTTGSPTTPRRTV